MSSQKRSATSGTAQGRGTRGTPSKRATGTGAGSGGTRTTRTERTTRGPARTGHASKTSKSAKAAKAAQAGRTSKPPRPRAATPAVVQAAPVLDEREAAREAARAAEQAARIEHSRQMGLQIVAAALDKKALMPALLDVARFGTYTDFLLIVSGRSDRHVSAIADGIQEALNREHGIRTLGTEGTSSGTWVLLDFGGVVVHVFYHPLREHYDLESLWMDAPRVPLEVPDEAMIPPQESY